MQVEFLSRPLEPDTAGKEKLPFLGQNLDGSGNLSIEQIDLWGPSCEELHTRGLSGDTLQMWPH